jgi:ribosomal protein S18 acetylase RimI-like enzyme
VTVPRRARPADAEALQRILNAAYAPFVERLGPDAPPLSQDIPAAIADEACLVAGDPPKGFIIFRSKEDGLLIENLAVDPAAQGQGIGLGLVASVEEMGRETGAGVVRLVTSPTMERTQAFYLGRGYVEIGSDRRRILMEKAL